MIFKPICERANIGFALWMNRKKMIDPNLFAFILFHFIDTKHGFWGFISHLFNFHSETLNKKKEANFSLINTTILPILFSWKTDACFSISFVHFPFERFRYS
jgi:hypothetical protein